MTKEQAAACILDQKNQLGLPVKACNYDQVVMDLLNLKRGPKGCGIMVPKDNSHSRIRDLVWQSLDISATPTPTEILIPAATSETFLVAKKSEKEEQEGNDRVRQGKLAI